MSKELPSNIKLLNDELVALSERRRFFEDKLSKISVEISGVYSRREKVCKHIYADGSSAWKDYYAYSACDICGYSDI